MKGQVQMVRDATRVDMIMLTSKVSICKEPGRDI
jgi:hypothetical protein